MGTELSIVQPNLNISPKIRKDLDYLDSVHYCASQIANHIQNFKDWDPTHPLTRLESFKAIVYIYMHHSIPCSRRECGRSRVFRDLTLSVRKSLTSLNPDSELSIDSEVSLLSMRLILAWLDLAKGMMTNKTITKAVKEHLADLILCADQLNTNKLNSESLNPSTVASYAVTVDTMMVS